MSINGMNGHVPGNARWAERVEGMLNRLVYETENGGLVIESGSGMESLTVGDGSELHSDKQEASNSALELQDGIKSGAYTLESGGFLENSSANTPVQQWYQLMDVFDVQQYAEDTKTVTFSHVDRLPRLLSNSSTGPTRTVERWVGFVPPFAFRDVELLYRPSWSSSVALQSSENGLETSGRGRVVFYPCGDIPTTLSTVCSYTTTIDEARHADENGCASPLRLVTYMGKDPILPYYVYQLHVEASKSGHVVRRLQRLPMPCTSDSVVFIVAYALKTSIANAAAMFEAARYPVYGESMKQKNWFTNDDADRLAVFNHVYNGLREVSRNMLDDALKHIAEAQEKDPLEMVNEADALNMPHLDFIKNAEVTRFFGGKRFAVLSRYFRSSWLGTLTVPEIHTLYERAMTRPFDMCFPGKKSWLLRDVVNGDATGADAPPLPPNTLPNRRVFVPEITLASCAMIHLDMLALRNYVRQAREAAEELVETWGKPFSSSKSSATETIGEFLDYVDGMVQQFLEHGSEELFAKACAYEMTRKAQVEGNHVYIHLGELTTKLRESVHCMMVGAVTLNSTTTEVVSMFSKVKVLNALHTLADGVSLDAGHKKLLAVVLTNDGADGTPLFFPNADSREARLADLKRHSTDVKVYPIHMYEQEAMIVLVFYRLATRKLSLHLSGERGGINALQSQDPNARLRFMLENCSEQVHAALQKMANKLCINLKGPGGAGKTQAYKMLNEQIGPRSMLMVSFMGTHINTLRKRLQDNSRATTIHRWMSLHSKLCKNADTCKHMSGIKRAIFNGSAVRYMEKLMRSYRMNEQNSDLQLLSMGWRTCPGEDLKSVAFEEASLLNSTHAISLLWHLYTCAPEFSTVFTAGDVHQMPSINGDLLQDALIDAFGQCEFDHVHRFKDRTLRQNADAIRDQNVLALKNEPITLTSSYRYSSGANAERAATSNAPVFRYGPSGATGSSRSDRDSTAFDRSKYESGVFNVEAPPERMTETCEYLIYKLQLRPEMAQFIMRTNAEVAELRYTIRNALICTARALHCGMDPHVYAIRNYGTREQIERFDNASPDGVSFGRLDPTSLLVFSQRPEHEPARDATMLQAANGLVKTEPRWCRPDVQGASQLEKMGRLDERTGYVVGQILQTTRNVPSLHINNLGRTQFVVCLYVRLELINDEWNPLEEGIAKTVDQYKELDGDMTEHERASMTLAQDETARAIDLMRGRSKDDVEDAAQQQQAMMQLYGDRQWALEQMNAQRIQMEEIERAKQRRHRVMDTDDPDVDGARIPGCDYAMEDIREDEGYMLDTPANHSSLDSPMIRTQHRWLTPETRMYLYTAIASGSISIAYAGDLVKAECARRCKEDNYRCALCDMSLDGKLFLDTLPEDMVRQLINAHGKKPKGVLGLMNAVDPKKIKMRIVKVQRTTAWDHSLVVKHEPDETPAFRILMTREMAGPVELQKEVEHWVHYGIPGRNWSEERALEMLQATSSPLVHSDLKFIPFEGYMCQLVRDGACITMHAMQGNQAHTVVCAMARPSKFCTYKHIYSASTRSTDRLIYVGSMRAIKRAIQTDDPVRNSDLGRLLRKLVNEKLGLDVNTRVDLRLAAIVELAENTGYGEVSNPIAQRYLAEPHMQNETAREAFMEEVRSFEKRKHRYLEAMQLGLPWDATEAQIERARGGADTSTQTRDGSDSDSDCDTMLHEQLDEDMQFLKGVSENMQLWQKTVEAHIGKRRVDSDEADVRGAEGDDTIASKRQKISHAE